MLDSVTQLARDAVTTLGYPGVFLAIVAENVFPPIPSEVVLPLAGFEANAGHLNFLLVVIAATLGSRSRAASSRSRPARCGWGSSASAC